MGTFGNSSKDKERMLRDQASYRKKLEKKRQEELDTKLKDEKFELKYKICLTKKKIISCEYDIKTGQYISNVVEKIKAYKEVLQDLENRLKVLE